MWDDLLHELGWVKRSKIIKTALTSSTDVRSYRYIEVFNCPGNPKLTGHYNGQPLFQSYAYNYYIGFYSAVQSNPRNKINDSTYLKKASQANKHVNDTILFTEKWTTTLPVPAGVTKQTYDLVLARYTSNISYGKYAAHPGGANALFLDGHAETRNYVVGYRGSSGDILTVWLDTDGSKLVRQTNPLL